MKRSTKVSLVLLASVSATATLSGCDHTPPSNLDKSGTFASQAECVATYDQQTCDAAQKLAYQEHLQNAPHFNSVADCQVQYGPDMCRPSSYYGGHDNSIVPFMLGYSMANAMSPPAPLYYAPYSYRNHTPGFQAPIYTSGTGYARNTAIGAAPFVSSRAPTTPGGLKAGTALSTGTVAPSSRGGFGSQAHLNFTPTKSFETATLASSPGRAASISATSGSVARSSFSSSARGGFGSVGRGFGGGFGG